MRIEVWNWIPYDCGSIWDLGTSAMQTSSNPKFKIWDFGYNHMEISILNNPLYIAYTLHPGSKLAKVLPEDCQPD